METTDFEISPGKIVSVLDKKDGIYKDVIVQRVAKKVAYVLFPKEREPRRVLLRLIEPPLVPDVNTRFTFLEDTVQLVFERKVNSGFITGQGGIGKSFTADQVAEHLGLEEDKDFYRIKGHMAPTSLYTHLYKHRQDITIFDDCDSVMRDPTSGNLLKAVLDNHGRRVVSWRSPRLPPKVPGSFEFSGSVLFISNLNKDKVEQAVRDRCLIVDLYMTAEEKIERMRYICNGVRPDLSIERKEEVLDMMDKYRNTIKDMSLRMFVKAIDVYAQTDNIELVRYQLLNS